MMKLEQGVIHLWYKRNTSASARTIANLADVLSEEERLKSKGIADDFRRAEFIMSRGLLRRILASYLDVKPQQLLFKYNSSGKPSLAGVVQERKETGMTQIAKHIKFSTAHSNRFFLFGFVLDREIGVDVELIRNLFPWRPEPKQIFPKTASGKLLQSLFGPVGSKIGKTSFFKSWTLMEAYLKANGSGLLSKKSFDLFKKHNNNFPAVLKNVSKRFHRIELGDSKNRAKIAHEANHSNRGKILHPPAWHYCIFRPAPMFTAAIVVNGPTPNRLIVKPV